MEDSNNNNTINTLNSMNNVNTIKSVKSVGGKNMVEELMSGITNEHAIVAKEIVYNSILSGQVSPNPNRGSMSPIRFNSLNSVNSFKVERSPTNTNPMNSVVRRSNLTTPKNSNPTHSTYTHSNNTLFDTNLHCDNSNRSSLNVDTISISSNESLNGMVVSGMGNVYLNIYDLENVHRVVNMIADTVGAGAYHAGVEVYGNEYNYGYNPKGGTGITSSFPKYHPYHTYLKSVDLGKTKFTPQQVIEIIQLMKPQWNALDYNILNRNCLNFAKELCEKLEVAKIPGWVMGLQNKINWTKRNFNKTTKKLKVLNLNHTNGVILQLVIVKYDKII